MTDKDSAHFFAASLAEAMGQARYAHLERRTCSADAPMDHADKDTYRWSHPDATAIEPYFNLMLYECPHCQLCFTALPPRQ